MKIVTQTVLPFPEVSNFVSRLALRKDLLTALRFSESPVILDLTGRGTLDRKDIDLLLGCLAQAAGRDTQLFLVARSRPIQVLLDVLRVSSLVPVFRSLEEAIAYPKIPAPKRCRNHFGDQLPALRSA